LERIDDLEHRRFVIARVMDRGSARDARLTWEYYGGDTVKAALLGAPALERKTVYFFANQFGLRPDDFRSYRKSGKLGTWAR
jgi:hypothetical protein